MADATAEPIVEQPAPAAPGGYASVTQDGITVDSNTETADEIRAGLDAEKPAPPADEKPPDGMERDAAGKFVKAAKPRHDPQARIDQITAKQKEAERKAEALERELAALRRPPAPDPKPAADAVADWKRFKALPDAPKLEQFETIEDYTMAVGHFIATKSADEREQRHVQQTQQQHDEHEYRELDRAWQTRRDEAFAADPTLAARVIPETPMSLPMLHAIKISPIGPQLLVYLSDHQDEAQRLSTLHPALVMRDLGKLEARLEAASSGPAPVVPAVSHAKPPTKPLGSSPVTNADAEPGDEASDDEWYRWNQRQKKRRA